MKAILLASAVALILLVVARADWAQAARRLRELGPLGVVVIVPFALAMLADSAAWRILIERLEGAAGRAAHTSRASIARLFWVRLGTEAVTIALPSGGLLAEAVGPALLARELPVARSFAASAAKRWLIVRSHGLYLLIAALLGWGLLDRVSRAVIGHGGLPWIVVGTAAAFAGLSVALERAATRLGVAVRLHVALRRLGRSRLLRALFSVPEGGFADVDANLRALGGQLHLGPALLILGGWLLESVESWLILRVLGAPLPFVDVLAFDAALSAVRSLAVFAPSGLGVLDVGYLAFFQVLGVPEPAAVGPAFLVLKRSKELFYVLLGGVAIATTRRLAADADMSVSVRAGTARVSPDVEHAA